MSEPEWLTKMRAEGRVVETRVNEDAFGMKAVSDALMARVLDGTDEARFQRCVIERAQELGWKVAHFRKARTKNGWTTPVQADGKGFPDLFLCKPGQCFYAELKVGNNVTTDDQCRWLEDLGAAGCETHVWHPEDWPAIRERLER
jgi:hypothetical protein